jgi:hypothetical protein
MNIKTIKSSICRYLIIFILSLGLTSFLSAQKSSPRDFPVTLYVSSQNTGYVDPVNITVTIDHNKIVNQDFRYGKGQNVSTFKFVLKEGQHQIVAESSNGSAIADVIFIVDRPLWLNIAYLGKSHFQLYMSPRKLSFL